MNISKLNEESKNGYLLNRVKEVTMKRFENVSATGYKGARFFYLGVSIYNICNMLECLGGRN